jgi:prepilin-type processing-associated H-X9-DG protein
MLLPALSKAKLRAQSAQCISNHRQMGIACQMQMMDEDKVLFGDSKGLWMGAIVSYLSTSMGTNASKVFLCPLAPVPATIPTGSPNGNAATAWVWGNTGADPLFGSYSVNNWLYDTEVALKMSWAGTPSWYFVKASAIQFPATTPNFVDGIRFGLQPNSLDTPPRNLYTGAQTPEMGRACIARHGGIHPNNAPRSVAPGESLPGAVNMTLADGHVEQVKLDRLWFHHWYKGYVIPNKRPN